MYFHRCEGLLAYSLTYFIIFANIVQRSQKDVCVIGGFAMLRKLFDTLFSVRRSIWTEKDATNNFDRWWKRHESGFKDIASLIGVQGAREYARSCIRYHPIAIMPFKEGRTEISMATAARICPRPKLKS